MAYNILLVDDSQTVKAVIAKALIMSGVDLGALFRASNGKEGLEILAKQKVDLVLADINMPIMGGVELVDRMKADGALRAIPIVIISTEGNVGRIEELKNKGINAFLRKPFLPESLKQTVDAILGGSHA